MNGESTTYIKTHKYHTRLLSIKWNEISISWQQESKCTTAERSLNIVEKEKEINQAQYEDLRFLEQIAYCINFIVGCQIQ